MTTRALGPLIDDSLRAGQTSGGAYLPRYAPAFYSVRSPSQRFRNSSERFACPKKFLA